MPKKAVPGAPAGAPVDWKKLKTAHGPAARVPELVKALVGGKGPADREAAYVALDQGLHADGALAPSAAATVPLLFDALVSKKEGAHRAAWLIGEALTGGHVRLLADSEAEIRGPSTEVRAAVVARKDALLAALADRDANVRAGAAFALAWAPDLADVSVPVLRKQLAAEKSDAVRLSQILALSLLAGGNAGPEDRRLIESARATDSSPMTRGGAALGALLLDAAAVHGEGLAALLESTVDREAIPWCAGHLSELVISIATRANERVEVAKALAAKLGAKAPAAAWFAALELGEFTRKWKEDDVALPEELSEGQKAIAQELARRDGITGMGWGIPRSGRDRRRWLGLTAPGPLEKRIAVKKGATRQEWPVWRVWRTTVQGKYEELPGVIAVALSPEETLEALAEVCTGAYGIRMAAGGRNPSPQLMAKFAEKAGAKGAAWARRFADEILALVEAGSAPELGGVIGMTANRAVLPAIVSGGGSIEPRWYRFMPLTPPDAARELLQKVPAAVREEIVWQKMQEPFFSAPTSPASVKAFVPLLDLVASKRIATELVTRLRDKTLQKTLKAESIRVDDLMKQMKAAAVKQPVIAEVLG